ncbi:MAG: hypothetical protein LQ342_008496 [Letrouitia transgressa]|nr:MAG: hypothetical protein LQ342_008496 [Letrouitia transgressa]
MGFLSFCYRQSFEKPSPIPANVDLAGQTLVVTGANVGLGLETTKELVAHKIGRVILAVRNVQRGDEARTELRKISATCIIEVWELDQNSFTSIEAFGKRAQMLDRVDIVILNAGVMKKNYIKSTSGHELHLQVNYLSTALLSLLLFPPLKTTSKMAMKPSHMTVVTSEMHMWTSFKQRTAADLFQKLDDESSFTPDHYSISKLLGVLWVQELALKTDSAEVIINAVNPGLCWSSLHRDDDSFGFRAFKHLFAWSSAQGGHCLADAATVQQRESHGGYLSEQKLTQ